MSKTLISIIVMIVGSALSVKTQIALRVMQDKKHKDLIAQVVIIFLTLVCTIIPHVIENTFDALHDTFISEEHFGKSVGEYSEISFGWGDNGNGRASFSMDDINSGCTDGFVTFNRIKDGSYTDDGVEHKLGDEKNFVRTRENGTHDVWSSNEIEVEDGREYIVNLYVNNNATNMKSNINPAAQDTRVSFSIPGSTGRCVVVHGFIMSSNAIPSEYWDSVVFKSDHKFHLEYISGSGLWECNNGSFNLSDEIISARGIYVGYYDMNGTVPAGYEYSGYASCRVKVVFD